MVLVWSRRCWSGYVITICSHKYPKNVLWLKVCHALLSPCTLFKQCTLSTLDMITHTKHKTSARTKITGSQIILSHWILCDFSLETNFSSNSGPLDQNGTPKSPWQSCTWAHCIHSSRVHNSCTCYEHNEGTVATDAVPSETWCTQCPPKGRSARAFTTQQNITDSALARVIVAYTN